MMSAVVVGGGASGLVAAWRLAQLGRSVQVFEAADHFGGAVCPQLLGGKVIDAGAEAIGLARSSGLELFSELGLSDQVVYPRRADPRIATPEGLQELPPGVLGIPASTDDPLVAALLNDEEIQRARAERGVTITGEMSVDEVVGGRLGSGVVRKIVDPVLLGIHAAASDELEFRTLFPGMDSLIEQEGSLVGAAAKMRGGLGPSGSAVASLRGGMNQLTARLVDACVEAGVKLNVNSRVSGLERLKSCWRINVDMAGELHAETVVLAVPPRVAATLLTTSAPHLAEQVSTLQTTTVKVVHLLVHSPELDLQPTGPGLLVRQDRMDVATKALTHSNAKWAWWKDLLSTHEHVLRLSFGKANQLADDVTDELTHDELLSQAEEDARKLLGVRKRFEIRASAVTAWPESLAFAAPGHSRKVAHVAAGVQEIPGISLLSSSLAGNGLAGVVAFAQAEVSRLTTIQQGEAS